MKHIYTKTSKIKYNNKIFRILVRDDKKLAFLKIVSDNKKEEEYSLPTAQEFLHLSSCFTTNRIKF